MSGNSLAPIVYFAFNRPEHTRRSLAAIKANALAARSLLYIYVDGPRADESAEGIGAIEQVRRIVASDQWCGRVELRIREANVGLGKGLPSAISETLEMHDRIIVVEDDVIVSPGFLEYMNAALDLYADDERVMHVSAFTSPVEVPPDYPETTFFYNHTTCWGWGTWRRAWQHFTQNGARLMREIDASGRKRYINLDNAHEYYWALRYLDEGRSQDWNCYWHVAVALRGGHCLHPAKSLTDNIGFDGSGAQCSADMDYQSPEVADRLPIRRIPVEEDRHLRAMLTQRPLRTRAELRFKSVARTIYFGIADRLKPRVLPERRGY